MLLGIGDPRTGIRAATPVDRAGEGACLRDVEVAGFRRLMAQRHIDPQFAYWTTSGEFVFVAVLAGYQSVAAVFVASVALELVRSFSNLYLPNTWQLVLGIFLLAVILFLPRGIGSLWIRDRHKRRIPATAPLTAERGTAP